MKYLMMQDRDRESLWENLTNMPDLLRRVFATLSEQDATKPGPDNTFSPVEQCWHLADLEQEGFGLRIRRLLTEESPQLQDFDGARVAIERAYKTKTVESGIQAFREARARNLEILRSLAKEQWNRSGWQEGVGKVALCDIPVMMAEHDAAHREEIAAAINVSPSSSKPE